MAWEQFKYRVIPSKVVLTRGWLIFPDTWLWVEAKPQKAALAGIVTGVSQPA